MAIHNDGQTGCAGHVTTADGSAEDVKIAVGDMQWMTECFRSTAKEHRKEHGCIGKDAHFREYKYKPEVQPASANTNLTNNDAYNQASII